MATKRESEKLDLILSNQQNQKETIEKVSEDVHGIYRAVYGDKVNKVEGLLSRQLQDEQRHKELKKDIEPVIRVHNFITSGKMWSIIIALGGIIGGIIKYLQYNG